MKASMVDLRYRTKEVIQAVDRGETVTLLYRGKEKAHIVPIRRKQEHANLKSHQAFGIWKDRPELRDVRGYVRQLRKRRFGDL